MIKKILNILKNGDIKFFIYEKISIKLGVISILYNCLLYSERFKIGKKYKVWGSIRVLIDGDGTIQIGDNFHAVSSRKRSYLSIFSTCNFTSVHGGKIIIGNHVGLNGTIIASKSSITIGAETMIGPNTYILDHDGHSLSIQVDRWTSRGLSSPIIIGKNCWIGLNCIILKGVSIGDNTVVAAGSVVVKSCEPNSLYAGNPAKKIKDLTS